jgi:hypothetical protein
MNEEESYCRTKAYCWVFRYEIVGLILLGIATFLTIITLSGLGIAAMFFVGIIFCGHKYFSCKVFHTSPHHTEDDLNLTDEDVVVKPSVRKPRKDVL